MEYTRNQLFLVRHGENPSNINKVFSSRHIDQSLNEKGRLQAQQTAAYFQELGIARANWMDQSVFTSPLKRAVETANVIAKRLSLEAAIVDAFREIDVGQLEDREGKSADWSLYQEVLDDWYDGKGDSRFPDGESYRELWDRVSDGLKSIVRGREGKCILLVSHGGILTLMLKDLCPDIDIGWLRQSRWDNCAITEIELMQAGSKLEGKLVSWNYHKHLEGAAAELIPGVPEDL